MPVESYSQPRPRQQCRKAHAKEPNGVGRYRAVDPQPQTAHGEYRHPDRLEDRALLVLGPTTKTAPDGRENAGKTGGPREILSAQAEFAVIQRSRRVVDLVNQNADRDSSGC